MGGSWREEEKGESDTLEPRIREENGVKSLVEKLDRIPLFKGNIEKIEQIGWEFQGDVGPKAHHSSFDD